MLSHDQMMCLWGGIGVAVLMGLCPPWSDYGQFAGYHLWWSSPTSRSHVSVVRLLVQWVILAGVTYAAIQAVPRWRHVSHLSVPSERTVMPAPGGLGDAIGGALRRATP